MYNDTQRNKAFSSTKHCDYGFVGCTFQVKLWNKRWRKQLPVAREYYRIILIFALGHDEIFKIFKAKLSTCMYFPVNQVFPIVFVPDDINVFDKMMQAEYISGKKFTLSIALSYTALSRSHTN